MAVILLQQKHEATTTHHSGGNYKDATTRRKALNEEHKELGNRSFKVKLGSGEYRCNRQDLLKTNEKPLVDSHEVDAPICGDDNSLTAAPAPTACDGPQADTNANGPRNTNANGSRSLVEAARLQFGKGTMPWDNRMIFFLVYC